MRGPRLDLLGEGVDVLEAAIEWAVGENRAEAGCAMRPIGGFDASLDGFAANEANLGAVLKIDNFPIISALVNIR